MIRFKEREVYEYLTVRLGQHENLKECLEYYTELVR
jgi:hypothetical protein